MAAGDMQLTLDGDMAIDAGTGQATTVRDNVDEVKLTISKAMYKWLKRGKKWQGAKPTAAECSIDAKSWKFEGDALITILKSAFLNNTIVGIYAKDASGEGMDADFYLTEWGESQDNVGGVEISWKAEATDEQRDPQYH